MQVAAGLARVSHGLEHLKQVRDLPGADIVEVQMLHTALVGIGVHHNPVAEHRRVAVAAAEAVQGAAATAADAAKEAAGTAQHAAAAVAEKVRPSDK